MKKNLYSILAFLFAVLGFFSFTGQSFAWSGETTNLELYLQFNNSLEDSSSYARDLQLATWPSPVYVASTWWLNNALQCNNSTVVVSTPWKYLPYVGASTWFTITYRKKWNAVDLFWLGYPIVTWTGDTDPIVFPTSQILYISATGNNYQWQSVFNASPNNWTYYAFIVSYTGNITYYFMNWTYIGSWSQTPLYYWDRVAICGHRKGSTSSEFDFLAGTWTIDEFRYYSRVLSTSEVLAIYTWWELPPSSIDWQCWNDIFTWQFLTGSACTIWTFTGLNYSYTNWITWYNYLCEWSWGWNNDTCNLSTYTGSCLPYLDFCWDGYTMQNYQEHNWIANWSCWQDVGTGADSCTATITFEDTMCWYLHQQFSSTPPQNPQWNQDERQDLCLPNNSNVTWFTFNINTNTREWLCVSWDETHYCGQPSTAYTNQPFCGEDSFSRQTSWYMLSLSWTDLCTLGTVRFYSYTTGQRLTWLCDLSGFDNPLQAQDIVHECIIFDIASENPRAMLTWWLVSEFPVMDRMDNRLVHWAIAKMWVKDSFNYLQSLLTLIPLENPSFSFFIPSPHKEGSQIVFEGEEFEVTQIRSDFLIDWLTIIKTENNFLKKTLSVFLALIYCSAVLLVILTVLFWPLYWLYSVLHLSSLPLNALVAHQNFSWNLWTVPLKLLLFAMWWGFAVWIVVLMVAWLQPIIEVVRSIIFIFFSFLLELITENNETFLYVIRMINFMYIPALLLYVVYIVSKEITLTP